MPRSDGQHVRRWLCSLCGGRVTTHVPLLEIPFCNQHKGGNHKMTEVDHRWKEKK